MSLSWFKPPREITCPVCSARVKVRGDTGNGFQAKPYCDNCGWNAARARKQLLAYVGKMAVIAPLFGTYAWAVSGIKWSPLIFGGFVLIVLTIPFIANFRRIPPDRPVPPLQPLAAIADVNTVALDTATPRLQVIIEGLIAVAAATVLVFLPRELDPALRRLPAGRHELLFFALTTIFLLYQLSFHSILFVRLARSIWLERHLAKRSMTGPGRVTQSNSGTIKYEFLDYRNHPLRGAGRDHTMGLYEDMPLSVLYDPDNPSLNMPLVGLQFHRARGPS